MISKSELIKILNFWNYWDKNVNGIKQRQFYENQLKKIRNSKEIIVIKGIRRGGKSSLLNLEIKNLKKTIPNQNILFVNFEEPKFMEFLNIDFLDYIYETYLEFLEPKGKLYIFLDEIQNIKGWEKWVLRMYEKTEHQIYVTGSSSKLLSSEFSTVLSGRNLSIEIFPLSFSEFLFFKGLKLNFKMDLLTNEIKIKKLFKEYLLFGGFPKITELKNDFQKKNELISYYDSIIFKDISKRHNICNISELKNLNYYLISNIGKLYSVNNLKKLNLGSYDTIKKYIKYFKEIYLLFELSKFDYSLKKQLVNPKKIYCIDTGFVNTVSFKFSEDIGRLLENLVFVELKRRNLEIYYHNNKKECDFIIKQDLKIIEVIQVTYSLNDEQTKKREFEGLIDAMKTYNLNNGLILTEDEEDEEKIIIGEREYNIKIKPIWKWLLEK